VSVASAPPPPAPAPAAQESQLWTREWKRQQETREYWQRRVDTAKQAVERIEQRIQYLERKRASIQNPFIPRPTLSEEDRVAEEGMDGAMRLARVEGQLASAREELAASRGAVEKAEQEMSAALAPEPPSGFAPSTN
jgi:outer membrane protein TolC